MTFADTCRKRKTKSKNVAEDGVFALMQAIAAFKAVRQYDLYHSTVATGKLITNLIGLNLTFKLNGINMLNTFRLLYSRSKLNGLFCRLYARGMPFSIFLFKCMMM